MVIFSVGHSTRTLDELVELLLANRVELLVDVRRFPRSKIVPHFNRENLEEELPKRGIGYLWMGELLGGFRRGGYEAYTKTESFKRGVKTLAALAREKTLAYMCTERNSARCHRRYISEALRAMGFRVVEL